MTTPVRPENPGERIRRNVAAMKAQGASDADIEAYLTQHEGLKPQPFDNAMSPRAPGKSDSFGNVVSDATSGAAQGMSFGFADEVAAGTMALVNKLFGHEGNYDKLVKDARDETKARAEHSPVANVVGNVAGAIAGGKAPAAMISELRGAKAAATGAREAEGLAKVRDFLMRRGRNIGVGAGAGAVAGFGSAEGDLADRFAGAGTGALWGGTFAGGLDLGGDIVRATGLPKVARNLAPRPNESASTAGQVAQRFGYGSHEQKAVEDILADIKRSGLSVDEYLTRAKNNPTLPLYDLGPSMNRKLGSPLAKVDPSGDPLVRRARGVQSVPSRGSAEISEFTNTRAEQRPAQVKGAVEGGLGVRRENVFANDVEVTPAQINDALESALGGKRQNTVRLQASLRGERAGKSSPLYEKAYKTDPIDDESVLSALDLPTFQEAYQRGQRIAKIEGVDLPSIGTVPAKKPLSVRTKSGALRADLSRVSREDLEAELMRMRELNSADDAMRGAIDEQGYRADYYELPDAERTGRSRRTTDQFGNRIKRQAEDLPDAGGMVDPDKLLADNKTIAGINQRGAARENRRKGMTRIEQELKRREPDASFDFGANVKDEGFDYYGDAEKPATRPDYSALPVQGLDYMKRGLDDVIQSKMTGGSMGRTEARVLRKKLDDVLDRVDAQRQEYADAREMFATGSRHLEAAEDGGNFWRTKGDELEVMWEGMSDRAKREYRKAALADVADRLASGMPPAQLLNVANARKLELIADSPDAYRQLQHTLGMAVHGDDLARAGLGKQFFSVPGDVLELRWPTLPEASKAQYRKNALAEIEDRLAGGMNPAQLLNGLNARKIRIIAGSPEAFDDFERSLRQTIQGQANDAMIKGGSPTARIMAEQADLGGDVGALQTGVRAAAGDLRGLLGRVLQNGATRRMQGLGEQRANFIAPFLTSSGNDLTRRLEAAKAIQDALEAALRRREIGTARVTGVLAGTHGGKP